MIGKYIGLALWVLLTVLMLAAFLRQLTSTNDSETDAATFLVVFSTMIIDIVGLIAWLLNGGLGI